MKHRQFFITGTDTEIGKTRASVALLLALRAAGLKPAAMKPVASGCRRTDGTLRNDDALDLLHASGRSSPYAAVNPYAFEPAVAPHLAAAEAEVRISIERILRARELLMSKADSLVVEGVGGWAVPLGRDLELRDLVRALDLPVILVVGMRLGCLNHALLTARQIAVDGFELVGWIARFVDAEMERAPQNLATLVDRLPAPCLGTLPHDPEPDPASLGGRLDLTRLAS